MMTSHATTRYLTGAMSLICGLLVASSAGADSTTADSWAAQGENNASVTFGAAGVVTVSTPAGSLPSAIPAATCEAQTTAPNASFSGDYARAGVTTADFDLSGDQPAAESRVILWGASGREWAKFGVSGNSANSVALNGPAGGWQLADGPVDGDLGASWAADLRNVSGIGVRLLRNRFNPATQSYTLSNFRLIGARTVGAAAPSLEDALLARFGVSSIADVDPAEGNADDDGDGMSNLNELLAENDATYFAENLFKATQVSSGPGGVAITFACVDGGSYTVQRAGSVDGAYEDVGAVTADQTGFETFIDSNPGSGPGFYQIVQQ